jgi:alanyl-tRNA synthetase
VLTSNEIRSKFIDYFQQHDHKFIRSAPVAPQDDPTLMFTNAGMNQFKDIFLGLKQPEAKCAVNSQKCIRVSGKHNDLEEVGIDTYHHTFFEMLGNWSFGDYFKEDTIKWAWELLTDVYGIDPDKLWATYFEGDAKDGSEPDNEARDLWLKHTTLPPERVQPFGKKDNFWEMGATGPCGPCSEIHIDLGEGRCDMQHIKGHVCAVNAGCARYIELWNLVFIQFNRQPDGKLERLKANYVDTGAGLERIASVLQKKQSNYDTDLFMPIINELEKLSGMKYTSQLNNKTDNAFRVVADHIRSLVFSITDGVTPSNEGRGYVMRRVLRRAARFGRVLDMHKPFMYKLVDVLVGNMGDAFPELKQRAEFVATVIQTEEASFGKTLDRGLELFATAAEAATDKILSGEDAFKLYDTFGFPLDLTQLLARERGLKVDNDKFDQLMQAQRDRARAAQKTGSLAMDLSGIELPATDDLTKYHADTCTADLLGWIDSSGYNTEGALPADEKVALVISNTCFYAESGGQQGDCGTVTTPSGKFAVENTERIADCIIHHGKVVSGSIAVGDKADICVDKKRDDITKNHTATHLLQWALQDVLGDSVRQQGSLVSDEYLRFDFTYPKALTNEQTANVENLIRDKIAQGCPITCAVMDIEQAQTLGAMALFNEKYGDKVRVVAVGVDDTSQINQAFSREFCGGIHVNNTTQIGGFKIVKEESISAGVRRITALTGTGLTAYLLERNAVVDELSKTLSAPVDQIVARVKKLTDDNKALNKQLKSASKQAGSDAVSLAKQMLEKAETIGDTVIVIGDLGDAPVDQIRSAADAVKKKAPSAAIVFGSAQGTDKVMLLAAVTDDLIKKGVKAGDIVKEIAPIVGGGGGGRPQMAQAGGKNPAKLKEALEKAEQLIKTKLQ